MSPNLPTQPGAYWWQPQEGKEKRLVQVYRVEIKGESVLLAAMARGSVRLLSDREGMWSNRLVEISPMFGPAVDSLGQVGDGDGT